MRLQSVLCRGGVLDRASLAAMIAAAAAVLMAGARLVAHDWDASFFVVAGDEFVHAGAPKSLSVLPSSLGYDGQFFYRLALDPFTTTRSALGIDLDDPQARQQRILYPLLAWLVAAGNPDRVPWALIAVNVVALGGLGYMGGAWARSSGQHALTGLALPAYPGFMLSLDRDLAEIVTACLLVTGLFWLRRRRTVAAAIALTLAALARETALLAVAAVWAMWLGEKLRCGRRAELASLPDAWLLVAVPLVCIGAWHITLLSIWGGLPVASGQRAFGLPLAGLSSFLRDGLFAPSPFRKLHISDMGFMFAFAVIVTLSLRRSGARRHEKLGWILALAAALSYNNQVWVEDWAFMRVLTELYVFGIIILFGRGQYWVMPVGAAAGMLWLASGHMRIHRV